MFLGYVNRNGLAPGGRDKKVAHHRCCGAGPDKIDDVGEIEARAWLYSVLVGDAGVAEDEAEKAVNGVFANTRMLRLRAESVATAAHATVRLPEGTRWWEATGKRAKDRLLAGDMDEYAEGWIAEIVDPAPDCWDPNWPESKAFHAVEIPEGKATGDTFVAGDGSGTRGRCRG